MDERQRVAFLVSNMESHRGDQVVDRHADVGGRRVGEDPIHRRDEHRDLVDAGVWPCR